MMKRKAGFLVVVLGLFIIIIVGIKIFISRGPKQGSLKVVSNPTATIFLNNKRIGGAPYDDKIEAGDYVIKLVPESTVQSLTPWEGNIKISSSLQTYVNASLSESDFTTAVDILWLEQISSKGSEVSITTKPDGASVTLDGESRGITPLSLPNVSIGEHTILLVSPGFVSRTVKIKTTAGFKLNSIIKLALSPDSGQPTDSTATQSASLVTIPTKSTSKTASSSASSSNPPKPYAVIKDSVKDTALGALRVRMEPTTSSTEAARVNAGDKFTILDTQNSWYQIKYDGKNMGWISGQYADKIE